MPNDRGDCHEIVEAVRDYRRQQVAGRQPQETEVQAERCSDYDVRSGDGVHEPEHDARDDESRPASYGVLDSSL